jgi:hypothetical protein
MRAMERAQHVGGDGSGPRDSEARQVVVEPHGRVPNVSCSDMGHPLQDIVFSFGALAR